MTWDNSAPLLEMQRGLASLLNNKLGGRFYDQVPSDRALPYTVIDSMDAIQSGAKGVLSHTILLVLKTYSRNSGGNAGVTAIQETIVEQMTTNRLTMVDWRETRKEIVRVNVKKDTKDNETAYVGLTSFNIFVSRNRST